MSRILLPALLVLLAACGPTPAPTPASTVTVTGAVCRPTPNGRQATGCYLTLTASVDDRLLSVTSTVGTRAQIHESRIESGMMMMRQLEAGLPLPAGESVQLAPGGNHIMLLGVGTPLRAGDTVPLTLTFTSAAPVEVTATVGQPAIGAGDRTAAH